MKPAKQTTASLAFLAMGIVYGDIGTSPLYAFKEVFFSHHPLAINPDNVLGILSLVFWAFVLIVSIKYLLLVTRADQNGEGGILTLSAIAQQNAPKRWQRIVMLLGILATGFFFGEAVITPAMSVLSAVEGIAVAQPDLAPYVLPIAMMIIVALFAMQAMGTERIGRFFAPVMLLWFLVLALLGAHAIWHAPQVLRALNPVYAVHFVLLHGQHTLFILGLVVLSVTGVEALYADMGHFGIKPIRIAWFALVMPSLLLNYFGQGAYLLTLSEPTGSTFFSLAPKAWLWPLILLATFATVIASQAVISGIFSLFVSETGHQLWLFAADENCAYFRAFTRADLCARGEHVVVCGRDFCDVAFSLIRQLSGRLRYCGHGNHDDLFTAVSFGWALSMAVEMAASRLDWDRVYWHGYFVVSVDLNQIDGGWLAASAFRMRGVYRHVYLAAAAPTLAGNCW